jgi:poly-beta-hydroxyalkanoate depolymerase
VFAACRDLLAPGDGDQDTYLMQDDFVRLGRFWREMNDEEATDFDVLVSDLLDGQYSSPVRVVC